PQCSSESTMTTCVCPNAGDHLDIQGIFLGSDNKVKKTTVQKVQIEEIAGQGCLELIPGVDWPDESERLLKQIQIEAKWGKTPVLSSDIANLPKQLRTAALSVAQFAGGTAFYIGSVQNRYFFATNAHVVVESRDDLAGDLKKYIQDPERICHEDQ